MVKMLQELLDLLPDAEVQGAIDLTITGIADDSRRVGQGTLFICLSGHKTDGHQYIQQACQSGAAAVLVERDVSPPPGITVIKVTDTRKAMQVLTPFFYDYPSRSMRFIGVTGTNGKTTTTHLIRSILLQAGYRVGLIGTIHVLIDEQVRPVRNTTPDVVELQEILADMAAAGINYVVMEVSSHALALDRVAGCEFDVAVFTNLTQDHLDFHSTLDQYLQAKAKLFSGLGSDQPAKTGKYAIINTDDPAAGNFIASCHCPVISYGAKGQGEVQANDITVRADGVSFTVAGIFGSMPLKLKITGLFNVYNVLAAICAVAVEGIEPRLIKQALESFQTVPGRFELVDEGQPFAVIVDYAHTPDGLENILKTATQFAEGRIIVVFGCGGDRDKTKRPLMGRLACQYGDIILATSDNPRTEDPLAILQDIEAGIQDALIPGKHYEVIPDRRSAIAKAVQLAHPHDIIIIAGKGHETYQILKDKTIPFDDREIARSIIKEMR